MEKNYKYDVFLSFSSADRDYAKPIWKELETNGFKVFFFEEELKKDIGHSFYDALENALEQSRDFVLICTPHAMQSEWVEVEYKTFYCEFYLKNKKERRLIILEGKGFKESSLPIMMRSLQRARSVSQIIVNIANKPVPDPESSGEFPPREKVGFLSMFQGIVQKENAKKILRRFTYGTLALLFLVVGYFIVNKLLIGSGKLYVSNLSFLDGRTLTTISRDSLRKSLDKAVEDGMDRAKKLNADTSSFTMSNPVDNAEKLATIIFDPELTKKRKIAMVIDEMMIPNEIDVIVSGLYKEDAPNPLITVHPLIIIKSKRKIIVKNFQFLRSELFGQDANTNESIVCDEASEEIVEAVEDLLERFELEDSSIKSLPFMDRGVSSSMKNKYESRMIHGVVLRGICEAKNKKQLVINARDHRISNTDANVNDLINYICDPNLTGYEKVKYVSKRMMGPNKVDVIVSGEYIEDAGNSTIIIRPFIICRRTRKWINRTLKFESSELFCPGQLNNNTIFYRDAFEKIARTVQELLEQI